MHSPLFATLRWFPSPKDLHVLNPKRFSNAGIAGELPHGLLRSFRIGKTSFACSMLSVDSKCLTTFHEVKKVRMNYKCLSMFFLFGVKGGLLFLITKKEKSPLKPRCSLNNKNASMSAMPTNKASNLQRFIKL